MKNLLTKAETEKLTKAWSSDLSLANLTVHAKVFNPYGMGTWYLLALNPDGGDELFAIVDLMFLEVGSVSLHELATLRVAPFNMPLERDRYFQPRKADELYRELSASRASGTANFASGGKINKVEPSGLTFNPNQVFVGYAKVPATPSIIE